jgi:hypothetical protein
MEHGHQDESRLAKEQVETPKAAFNALSCPRPWHSQPQALGQPSGIFIIFVINLEVVCKVDYGLHRFLLKRRRHIRVVFFCLAIRGFVEHPQALLMVMIEAPIVSLIVLHLDARLT